MTPTDEIWRPIPGYLGLYEASSLGRVRGCARIVKHSTGSPKQWRERVLKQHVHRTPNGRYFVCLAKDGVALTAQVSRLVARAFLGEPLADKPHVAHLDGNALNNRVENLQWVSPRENESHKKLHGTAPIGSRNPYAKLTEAQVAGMRRMYAAGFKVYQIAAQFQTNYYTTWGAIRKRHAWTHVKVAV